MNKLLTRSYGRVNFFNIKKMIFFSTTLVYLKKCYYFCIIFQCRGGGMVDTRDLKSLGHYVRAGSSPALGTINMGMTGID